MPPYFWAGIAARLFCLPFLLQWFHPDERQMLEFAHYHAHGRLHPFLESEVFLRNQTLPYVFSWLIRALDGMGLAHPWAWMMAIHAVIGLVSWLALTALVERFRRDFSESGRVADALGWFFALFWVFPWLASRGLLEAASLPFTCMLYLALRRRDWLDAGFLAGATAIFRYPSALWGAGGALLAARDLFQPRAPAWRWIAAILIGTTGLGVAALFGGFADLKTYGRFLVSAPAYWDFNRPHGPVETYFGQDSLLVYWKWFAHVFTPWVAPFFLAASAYALACRPALLLFCLPYIAGHMLTPHREPRFMLPLMPFLALAIAESVAAGRWRRLHERIAGLPRGIVTGGKILIGAHLLLNFAWIPLQAWGQWQSAQGALIRGYSRLAQEPGELIGFGDPLIDALVPERIRWADRHCQWHRPPIAASPERFWLLGREAPAACERVVGRELPAGAEVWERILRVRMGSLWSCPPATREGICPNGFKKAGPREPLRGNL